MSIKILLNGPDARAPIFQFDGEEGADRRTLLSFQERLTPRASGILLTSEALTLCVLSAPKSSSHQPQSQTSIIFIG
jgi:hypothetical protein